MRRNDLRFHQNAFYSTKNRLGYENIYRIIHSIWLNQPSDISNDNLWRQKKSTYSSNHPNRLIAMMIIFIDTNMWLLFHQFLFRENRCEIICYINCTAKIGFQMKGKKINKMRCSECLKSVSNSYEIILYSNLCRRRQIQTQATLKYRMLKKE